MAPGPGAAAKVRLLRSFDPAVGERATASSADDVDLDVPDPYYGTDRDYVVVHDLIAAALPGMLAHVRAALGTRSFRAATDLAPRRLGLAGRRAIDGG